MTRSTWWMITGIAALIGGVLALFNPFAGSLAATVIAAWSFLLTGLLCLIAVFAAPGAGNKILFAIIGVIGVYLGITLIQHPLAGMMTLTLAVGLLIGAGAIMRLFAAFAFRGTPAFWMMILSSVISFLLAFMILSDYPQSAATILGILLGVDLIFNGIALISLASSAKRVERAIS